MDLREWVYPTRDKLMATGWRVIPWFHDTVEGIDKPRPYGSGEEYSAKHPAWMVHNQPNMFSVALDDAILLDVDYNKENCITAGEFKELFGDLGVPHQVRESDNSIHYLFRLPDGVDVSTLKQSADGQLAKGVDIKRANQLIHIKADKILPHGGTLPARFNLPEAPQVLIEALRRKERPAARVNASTDALQFTTESTAYGRKALEQAKDAIATAPEGERWNTLNREVFSIFSLVAGGELTMEEADQLEHYSTLPEHEAHRGFEKAKAEGLAYKREAPPRVASPDDFPMLPKEQEPKMKPVTEAVTAALAGDAEMEFQTRFRLMDKPGGKVAATANNYTVRGVLPAKGIGLLIGKSSGGKTFCALSIAASIASNRGHWGGRYCARGSVVYIAGEPGMGIAHRMRALSTEWNDGEPFENLHVIEGAIRMSEPLHVQDMHGNKQVNRDADIYELFRLVHHINQQNPDSPVRMIVCDTVSQTMSGDQNSRQDVSNYLGNYALLAQTFNLCVMGIHHVGKDEAKGATGSAAWRDNVDFLIHLTRGIGERVTLTYDKLRDGDEAPETFRLKPVRFEQDYIDQAEIAFAQEQAERPGLNLPRYEEEQRIQSYGTLVFDDTPAATEQTGPIVPTLPYYPEPSLATSREKLVGALLRERGGRAPERVLRDEFAHWVKKLEQTEGVKKTSWIWSKAVDRLLAQNDKGESKLVLFKEGETAWVAFRGFEKPLADFDDLSVEND